MTSITPPDLIGMKRRGERIAVVTGYDAPSALLAEAAGVDAILVGDSAAMTVLGHDSTVHVTVDEMLLLTRAVSRRITRPLVIADMPFGSFQASDQHAVAAAVRFVKEGGASAVKIEGAGPAVSRAAAIVSAGIPVVGHVGLTPQSAVALGGYRAQGRTVEDARRLHDDALELERAGCCAVVLEAVPAEVAARITAALGVPTIGIGAGPRCDGQVLVWHDLLGLTSGPVPRFVQQYANLSQAIQAALEAYVGDVRGGRFPADRHTYPMVDGELDRLRAEPGPSPSASRRRG